MTVALAKLGEDLCHSIEVTVTDIANDDLGLRTQLCEGCQDAGKRALVVARKGVPRKRGILVGDELLRADGFRLGLAHELLALLVRALLSSRMSVIILLLREFNLLVPELGESNNLPHNR